jgi:hypothetical protein
MKTYKYTELIPKVQLTVRLNFLDRYHTREDLPTECLSIVTKEAIEKILSSSDTHYDSNGIPVKEAN